MQVMTEHVKDGVLEEYCRGTLQGGELDTVEQHLLLCADCRGRVASEDAYQDAVRKALKRPHPAPVPARWLRGFRGTLPIVMPALAAVTAILVVFTPRASGPRYRVELETTRGGNPSALEAPAGRPLELVMNVSGLPDASAYSAEVVDSNGIVVWTGAAKRIDRQAIATTARTFRSGVYWVRIYSRSGDQDPLREFHLRVR